jgi:hypothetical protein
LANSENSAGCPAWNLGKIIILGLNA